MSSRGRILTGLSPINFPADRLPEWLRAIHLMLPFPYMAEVIGGVRGQADGEVIRFSQLRHRVSTERP